MEEEVNVTNSSIILLGAPPLAVLEVGEVGGAASEVTHAQIESCYNLSCASSSGVSSSNASSASTAAVLGAISVTSASPQPDSLLGIAAARPNGRILYVEPPPQMRKLLRRIRRKRVKLCFAFKWVSGVNVLRGIIRVAYGGGKLALFANTHARE